MMLARRSLLAALAAGAFGRPAFAADWKPTRAIELIVPSAAGGGLDVTGRAVQRALHDLKLTEQPVNVVNKPGGGGAIGIVYGNQHRGDGHFITVQSPALLLNRLIGMGSIGLRDVTPVATLVDEEIIFTVARDSPFKTGRELAAKLVSDPQSVSIAMSASAGGHSHLAAALVTKAAGGDPRKIKIISFNGGGEAVTALLGGHVDVTVTPASSILGSVEAGKLRVIAIPAARHLSGKLASAPTWQEQGIDVVFTNWRALAGPIGMTAAQRAWWDDALAQITKTPEWATYVQRNEWTAHYRNSAETAVFLAEEEKRFAGILKDLDLLKS